MHVMGLCTSKNEIELRWARRTADETPGTFRYIMHDKTNSMTEELTARDPENERSWKQRFSDHFHRIFYKKEQSPLLTPSYPSMSESSDPPSRTGSVFPIVTEQDETKRRSRQLLLMWKDILILALGCAFYNFGYLGFLYNLTSLHVNLGNLAYHALTLLTATQVATSLFLPTVLVRWIGCKRLLIISAASTVGLSMAQFYPSYITFMPAVTILGIGNICVWVVMGIYVSNIGRAYVVLSGNKLAAQLGVFFGVVNIIRFGGGLLGNVVPLVVFSIYSGKKQSNESMVDSFVQHDANLSYCGVEYCNEPLNQTTNREDHNGQGLLIIYGTYVVVSCIGPLVVLLFLNGRQELEDSNRKQIGIVEQILASMYAMKDIKLTLLVITFINAGVLRSFATGDFSNGFILCSMKMSSVSMAASISNALYALLAFLGGLLIKYLGLRFLMLAVTGTCAFSYSYLFAANPVGENGFVALMVISGCMGAAMGSYNTLTNTLLGLICKTNKAGGFSNYRFFYAIGSTLGYAWSSSVCMEIKIPVLLALTVLGTVAYIVVSFKINQSEEPTENDGNS